MDIIKLKEKIQLAVPSIMKLEFGCRILNKKGYGNTLILPRMKSGSWSTLDGTIEVEEIAEILGRTITLADVLLADRHSLNAIRHQKEIINYWDLKDNDLDNQSDECKKFLIDLLK